MRSSMNFWDWALPLGILLAAILCRPLLRRLLMRISSPIREIAPTLSWILIPLALHWSADEFPLGLLGQRRIASTAYVSELWIVLFSARIFALSSLEWAAKRMPGIQALREGFFPLLKNLITLVIFSVGTIMTLQHFGQDVWSLITALGVGSLAVGLAAKDSLSHMISGFILIVDRNLRPGDRISFAGASGTVEEIGLRSTRLLTGQGSTWIVPNSELVNTKILNFSVHGAENAPGIRVSTAFRISLDTSLENVRNAAAQLVPQVAQVDPTRRIDAQILQIIEGTQLVEVGFWIRDPSPEQQSRAVSDFLEKFSGEARSRQIRIVAAAPATG